MFAPRGANSPPARHRREASALWAVARSAKRPAGVSKYKGCARPARRTPIFARERNEQRVRVAPSAKIERPGKAGRYEFTLEGTEGSVSPVARREACALWALGPKAQSDPKRGSETMSATVREARMIEQPGHLPPKVAKRPEGVNRNERRTRPAAAATIEVAGLRVLQTSPNGLFDSLSAPRKGAGREGMRLIQPWGRRPQPRRSCGCTS